MKAIILVGGFGTRLRPLTLSVPKQMLPIAGIPQIERKIAHLVSYGVDDIVLSLGYKPDAFFDAYPDGECAGARLSYVVESEPLGTAGAIAYAARQAHCNETFLAMNGDVLTDLDIAALVRLHRQRDAEGTIALTPVDDPSRFGVVVMDDTHKVSAFLEKPKREEAPTNLINAGTYVLEPSFVERVQPGEAVSIERVTFPAMVDDGRLYAGAFDKYFIDIGTPEALVQGNLDVVDREHGGKFFAGANVRIASDAVVVHSVIGDGVTIASGATVRESVIFSDVLIEAGANIEQSIVGNRAVIGENAQLHDVTVVGADVSVQPGAVLRGEKVSSEDE